MTALLILAVTTLLLFISTTITPSLAVTDPVRCFENGAQFPLAGADACQNEMLDAACDVAFPIPAVRSPLTAAPDRDARCNDPLYYDDAIRCARNCFLCCERAMYACDDASADAPTFCINTPSLCTDYALRELALYKCPRTCGMCDQRRYANGSMVPLCRDTSLACRDSATMALCQVPEYKEVRSDGEGGWGGFKMSAVLKTTPSFNCIIMAKQGQWSGIRHLSTALYWFSQWPKSAPSRATPVPSGPRMIAQHLEVVE